jgi:hypothetical protein
MMPLPPVVYVRQRYYRPPWEPMPGDPFAAFKGGIAYAHAGNGNAAPVPGVETVTITPASTIASQAVVQALVHPSALALVKQPGVTPDDVVAEAAAQWTPENVYEQFKPAKIAKALSPTSWATPQAIAPGLIQSLALAAVMAAMV